MAQDHQLTGVWTCDDEECPSEVVMEGYQGMAPAFPQGWVVIQDGPWTFHCCGWECVARHAEQKRKERDARLERRKAQKEALNTEMPVKAANS